MNPLKKYNRWLNEIAYGDKSANKWFLFIGSSIVNTWLFIGLLDWWIAMNEVITLSIWSLLGLNHLYITGLLVKAFFFDKDAEPVSKRIASWHNKTKMKKSKDLKDEKQN